MTFVRGRIEGGKGGVPATGYFGENALMSKKMAC